MVFPIHVFKFRQRAIIHRILSNVETILFLLALVTPSLPPLSIPPNYAIAAALFRLAHAASFNAVARRFDLDSPTACRVFYTVCKANIDSLGHLFELRSDLNRIVLGFGWISLPNCCGVLGIDSFAVKGNLFGENGSVMVQAKIPPDDRIPATIITGFLGSGKLITYGEVDIDGSLVAAKAAGVEDIIMLNNGCLCCTVRGDLVSMIGELVSKKKGKFDHIVIETTGLANPAPIIQTFYAEDQIFNDVKLDGVVTLVDAKHANIHLDDVKPKGVVNEAVEQIAYADRIIVNKTDLVGSGEVATLIQRIKGINRMAELKRTEFGKVDLDYVLGIGGFDLERIDAAIENEASKEDEHHHDHEHEHEHGHGHDHHHHDHHDHTHDPGVSSVSIVCEGSLDLEKANYWLGTLLMDRSEDIYRMKGLLSIEGMDERFVFQGVHDIFQGSPDRPWNPDESRVNKIVFIGKNLDAQELEKGFKTCLL